MSAMASSSTSHLRPEAAYRDDSASPHTRTSNLHPQAEDEEAEEEYFDPFSIDPAYRLRSTKTAHSVIAESIRSEAQAEGRKRKRLFANMKRKSSFIGGSLGLKNRLKNARPRSSTIVSEGSVESRRQSLAPTITSQPAEPVLAPLPASTLSSSTASAAPSASASASGAETSSKKPRDLRDWFRPTVQPPARRTVFINIPLPPHMVHNGNPIMRYCRNKVRTAKYTIITFLPKNLFEQFRRVANIYFLALVVLQLFSIFGAPNAQIGMLPLVFILGMTAIKDGFEDWRRAKLDNEVNNSATTKLGGWRNVNQPADPRALYERILGIGQTPGKTSKGVRKLREMEADAGREIVMERAKEYEQLDEPEYKPLGVGEGASPDSIPLEILPSLPTIAISEASPRPKAYTPSIPSTTMSKRSAGVLDWNRPGAGGTAGWERTLWKKLEVGDIVLLRDNEQVPADLIVLSTSNPDNVCFVETKNLDGETNLKVRKPLKATSRIMSEEDIEHAHFMLDSEPPHANLYNYKGVLQYQTPGKAGLQSEAVTINEMLLRGCTLRNTKWIIGLVLFTGADTKIMLNGGDTPSKRSKIEKETNFNVIMNFALLMILCLVTAILHGYYVSLSGTSADLYEIGAEASSNIYLDSVIIFFSCLIVFQNIVPISLYITIEVVKTIQAFFIFQDVEMYYDVYDTPCVPKTWNISDDLGQIEYVFSDKTGTLTQNIMEFKKCSIQGTIFGEGMTEAMMGAAKRDGRDIGASMEDQEDHLNVLKNDMLKTMTHTISNRYLRPDKLTLIAPELPKRLVDATDPLRPDIINFFRAIAICHTVLSDAPDPNKPHVLDYKAESPDEAALVAAARDVGFPFVNRGPNRLDIEVLGKVERWTPLRVLEFNSTRKRMSVVVRDPNDQLILFTKGADSVIYERLAKDHDQHIREQTLKDLEVFANGGLRTLCIAWRHLTEAEFTEWSAEYDNACAAVVDREEEIEKACELVEHSLTILGATALEDKLQEGVPDAIATLHEAGIKLWILTGDKLQTAIEIGYSCNLLTNDMEVMIISADSEAGARAQIEAGLNKIASVLGPPDLSKKKRAARAMQPLANFAVVIDGDSLRFALQDSLKPIFLSLTTQCAAVICCRVSPSQKALTVRLVKDGCHAMTLSIGDGANDVAMIQEANVGVGLFGLEGSQAAMSADYAFGQFRFLTRLLLVHGRWSYIRIADMHANFFYKQAIWTVSMFWFQIFNGFDATYLFEYTFLLLYNLVFTSLPVGILGALDQDTNAKASMAFPQLYRRGMLSLDYTRARFWLYMGDGLYQSAIIFFIPFLAYGQGQTWSSSGRDTSCLFDLGTTIAVAAVICANLYVGINTRYWTIIMWIIYVGSTLLIFIWIPIYSALAAFPFAGEVSIIYPLANFWFIVIITVFCAVGPRWLISSIRQSYFPRDKDIIREAWITGVLKDELGIKRRKSSAKGGGLSTDSAGSFAAHVQSRRGSGFTEEDIGARGDYEAANMYSPARERPISPLISESGTPRGPFSYPPSPAQRHDLLHSPTNRHFTTVPPPLTLVAGSNANAIGTGSAHDAELIDRYPNFSSPSGTPPYVPGQTMDLTQQEIHRLSRTSQEIKRSSLTIPSAHANAHRWPGQGQGQGHALQPIVSNESYQEDVFAAQRRPTVQRGNSTASHHSTHAPGGGYGGHERERDEWEEVIDKRHASAQDGGGYNTGYAV